MMLWPRIRLSATGNYFMLFAEGNIASVRESSRYSTIIYLVKKLLRATPVLTGTKLLRSTAVYNGMSPIITH